MQPARITAYEIVGAGNGVGIAVDRKDRAVRGFQDGARVTAGAERAVDIDGAVAWACIVIAECGHNFRQQDWLMTRHVHCPPSGFARRIMPFSRARRRASAL